jgi:uncharacterized protein YceH (UPF0502 family)
MNIMSILVGIIKDPVTEGDEIEYQQIIRGLIDRGYVREIVKSDDRAVIYKFSTGKVDILPAYEIDRILNA